MSQSTPRPRPEGDGEAVAPPAGPAAPLQYRQGDVFLLAVPRVPDGATPVAREDGRLVLAHGEVTGHAHAVAAPDGRLLEHEGARFLAVPTAAVLVHEEHAPIALPPGTYRVVIQREYVPAEPRRAAAWRRVAD